METNSINSSDSSSVENMNDDALVKRERLFWIQAIILSLLLVITGFTFLFYNGLEIVKGIKIVFAPFLSVVPLIFTLTIIRDRVKNFTGKEYTRREIIRYTLITVITAILFALLTKVLSLIVAIEILIAVIIAIISVISFVSIKMRDILGISILTGISEGIIIYMVFFF